MVYENWGHRWGGLVVLGLLGAALTLQVMLGAGWVPWALAGLIFLVSLPLLAPYRVAVRGERLTVEGLFCQADVPLREVRWVRFMPGQGLGPGLMELDLGPGRPTWYVCVYDLDRLADEVAPYLAHAVRTGTPGGQATAGGGR